MKNISVLDTLNLSLAERIQLVQDIWDSIAAEAGPIELTEWEKKVLDERFEAYRLNPDLGSPWNDVFKRITEKNAI